MSAGLKDLTDAMFSRYALALSSAEYRRAMKAGDIGKQGDRLGDAIAFGIGLYECLRLIERNWRNEVLGGQTPYDPDEEREIEGYFRQWLEPTQGYRREIRALREKGHKVRGAKAFVEHVREARRVAAGDSPFFDQTPAAWKWSAIASKRLPRTRPVRIEPDGRVYEADGRRFVPPGLTPSQISEMFSEEKQRPGRTLRQILDARDDG